MKRTSLPKLIDSTPRGSLEVFLLAAPQTLYRDGFDASWKGRWADAKDALLDGSRGSAILAASSWTFFLLVNFAVLLIVGVHWSNFYFTTRAGFLLRIPLFVSLAGEAASCLRILLPHRRHAYFSWVWDLSILVVGVVAAAQFV